MIIIPHLHASIPTQQFLNFVFSGKESYLDRLSLAQLTQLFLTSVLECPFYKVRIET